MTPSAIVRLRRPDVLVELPRFLVRRDVGANGPTLLPDAIATDTARGLGRDLAQVGRETDAPRTGFFLERLAHVVVETNGNGCRHTRNVVSLQTTINYYDAVSRPGPLTCSLFVPIMTNHSGHTKGGPPHAYHCHFGSPFARRAVCDW